MDDNIVDAKDIWFKYDDEWVINNQSLSIENGEVISIVGSNGSGKTTLSKLLVGELTPNRGEIHRRSSFSYTIRYQDYSKNLLPWYSARYNYKLASNDDGSTITRKWFEVGNYERWKDQKVSSLSGGQKQILSIICTLVMPADCVVLDEPFSAIDPERKSELWDVLYEWQKELEISIIVISHLIDEAISLADRLMVMKSGTNENVIYKKQSNKKPSKYLSTKESDEFRKKVSKSFYGISDI
jgi:ABC-type multidrug transport system ATPase subunit